jgi:hypothetical protein
MEGWKKFLNKEIVIFYDDGVQVSKKIGNLVSFNEKFLHLKISDSEVLIPINRVVRIEISGKNE